MIMNISEYSLKREAILKEKEKKKSETNPELIKQKQTNKKTHHTKKPSTPQK